MRTRYSDGHERSARMPERDPSLSNGRHTKPHKKRRESLDGKRYGREPPATVSYTDVPAQVRAFVLPDNRRTGTCGTTASGNDRAPDPDLKTTAHRSDGRPSKTPDRRSRPGAPFSAFGSSRTPGFSSPTSASQPPVATNRAAFHTETRTQAVFPLFSSGKTGDGFPRSIPSNCPARHGNRHIARKPECRTNGTRSAYRSKRFSFAIGRDDETIACGNRAKGSRNFYG